MLFKQKGNKLKSLVISLRREQGTSLFETAIKRYVTKQILIHKDSYTAAETSPLADMLFFGIVDGKQFCSNLLMCLAFESGPYFNDALLRKITCFQSSLRSAPYNLQIKLFHVHMSYHYF